MIKITKITILSLIIFYMLLSACVKDISVELPRPENKLVVEAYIDLDSAAVVFLTKNLAFFDPIDSSNLSSYIVWGDMANVVVRGDGITDTLRPQTFEQFPHKGYIGENVIGRIGGEYELEITYEGNKYSAITTIPDTIAIDSVWFRSPGWFPEDSLAPIGVAWTDPPGYGDYYLVKARVEGKQAAFYRPYIIMNLLDDRLDDGNKMMLHPFFRPYDGNAFYGQIRDTSIDILNYLFYKIGDTVSVKLSKMDAYSFRFWSSFFRVQVTDGNPFANPASLVSNIKGENVEGYWAGYGSYIKTVHIKDSVTTEVINL